MGVRLTPMKARFFDLIAGQPGIGMAELQQRMGLKNQRTVAVYAVQLNGLLEDAGCRVRGHRGYGYRLELLPVNGVVDHPCEIVYSGKLPRLGNGARKISQRQAGSHLRA